MQICLISPGHLSTNPRLVKEARALRAAGHEIVVICGRFSAWGIEADLPLARELGRVIAVPFGPINASRLTYIRQTLVRRCAALVTRMGFYPSWLAMLAEHPASIDLVRAAANVRADLYIAHYVAALPAAALAARRNRARYAFDAEDFHLGDLPDAPIYEREKRIIRTIEGRYLPGAAYVTAASPMIADAYAQAYGIPRPTPLLNLFSSRSAPAQSSPRGTMHPGPSLYWFSQTLGAGRGIETAIEAISLARTSPHLYLRGHVAPRYLEVLNTLAARYAVVDRIHLPDLVAPDTLEREGAAFDLGYVGELGETQNRGIALTNKLFSYLVSGIGVIATDIPAHRDIAGQLGDALHLFKTHDANDLARVLDQVLSNPTALAKTRRAAFELARTRYNWELEAQKLTGLVSRLEAAPASQAGNHAKPDSPGYRPQRIADGGVNLGDSASLARSVFPGARIGHRSGVAVTATGDPLRRCLIVSPHFPPSTVAGVHRTRHLAKHLPAHGWEPAVIAVDPAHQVEALDPALRGLVPATVRIIETGALPARWTAPFGLRGEIGLRGFFHLRAALAREIAEGRPELVLITGSPFYPMLLARWITRRFGVPVVLDLQDPWASKEGALRRRWTKGWIAHRLAVALEPRALKAAAWVTTVSERQNTELAERYAWLDPARMSAIPIGGDPADYDALHGDSGQPAGDLITFSYVGTALPRAAPLLTILFEGLARLRARSPDLAARLQMRFVGTSNQPGQSSDYRVRPLAHAAGVADLVTEQPGRVPYLDALRLLGGTHAVLMIGSDEPHYTASKIYPGLMSGRPFLSIFHAESSAHTVLSAAGGGVALAYTGEEGRAALIEAVAEGLARLANDAASLGQADPAAFADFTAHAVAGKYADVFQSVANR